MDEERDDLEVSEESPNYAPRPAWQVWAARIGLVIFLGFLVMYYVNISKGGL